MDAQDALLQLTLADPLLDVVIIDYHLSGTDGARWIATARTSQQAASVPFVGFTGTDYTGSHAALLAAGARLALTKPMTFHAFFSCACARRVLALWRTRRTTYS